MLRPQAANVELQPLNPTATTAGASYPHPNAPIPSRLSGYLPTLDGWRAIAILMVMGYHTLRVGGDHWYNDLGVLGVEIFFGISGLLICSRLLEESVKRGRISLSNFYIRRAFRILPPAWLYLFVLAIMFALRLPVLRSWSELASCLFFYRNYMPEEATAWYTVHFWSLMVEEHFYLLFPVLLTLLRARRALWILPLILVGLALWQALDIRTGLITDLLPGVIRARRTDLRLANLLWGCWIAIVLFHYPPFGRVRLAWVYGGIVSLILVLSAQIGFIPPLHGFVRGALIPVALAGTVLAPRSPLGWLLERALFRWIGRISYSLYLWQQLFFVRALSFQIPGFSPLQQLPWNLAAAFACAIFSYYLLERPLIRLGHRLATPAPPA